MIQKIDEYFLTVANTGSLSKAAKTLFVAQPSLTKAIHRLEAQLGVPLFDRGTKPLRLNAAGKIYYEHLIQSMEAEKKLQNDLREALAGKRGSLNVGVPSYLGQFLFSSIIPPFHRTFPNVTVSIFERPGSALQEKIASGELDIAFAYAPVSNDNVDYITISKEFLLLAMPCTAPKIDQKPVVCHLEIENFPICNFVLYNEGQLISETISRFFKRYSITPKTLLRSSNPLINLHFIAEIGDCATFIPSYAISLLPPDLAKRLSFYHLESPELEWEFRLLYNKHMPLNVFSHELLRLVSENHRQFPLIQSLMDRTITLTECF